MTHRGYQILSGRVRHCHFEIVLCVLLYQQRRYYVCATLMLRTFPQPPGLCGGSVIIMHVSLMGMRIDWTPWGTPSVSRFPRGAGRSPGKVPYTAPWVRTMSCSFPSSLASFCRSGVEHRRHPFLANLRWPIRRLPNSLSLQSRTSILATLFRS